MFFNPLKTFKQHRIARAGVALLVLVGAAFAEYKLANIPRPVDLKATGGAFLPATIGLRQEMIIKTPEAKEGILFFHDGKNNESVDVSFDGASLGEETRDFIESYESEPPSTATSIHYQPDSGQSSAGGERCSTQIKLSASSKMPDEIHIFQVGDPGLNNYRHLAMTTKGAEIVSTLWTMPPANLETAPGCDYKLTVGKWSEEHWTSIPVTIVMSENSEMRMYFRSLTPDSSPWGAVGMVPFDLGPPSSEAGHVPPFRASAVSIKSLEPGNERILLSAKSTGTKPAELLTIRDMKIGSDQIQVSIDGTGWVEIGGEPWTVNVMKRLEENKILGALLTAANIALLGWLSRMVFKTPKSAPAQAP